MSGSRPKIWVGIILALFFAFALYLRVYLPYDKVFTADWIKFTSSDAYYYMRLVDNLVHNFPSHTIIDPYFIYPGVTREISIRFFGWLLASVSWMIGLGSPTQHTIDVVSAYFPAVLGALTVIPVYFIGKELFGRWAGVLAAGLLILLPGEFLGRSLLGFTDHHVAEVLFTATAMLFLILAIKTARQRSLTFSHLKRRDWATSAKPLIYSLLAGVALGIYSLTFLGTLLFVFIIAVYFIIQFIIDHLKGKSTDYLGLVGVSFFLITLILSLLIPQSLLTLASMVIAIFIPLVLSGVSRLMADRKIKPAYYPLTVVGLGLFGLIMLYLINPSLIRSMLGAFSVFAPGGAQLTTLEMQPIFSPRGDFSFAVAWGNFPGLLPLDPGRTGLTFRNILSFMTTTFFISVVSLGILAYLMVKRGDSEKTLLVVWSLVILAATLGQRRFAYYFAVNVALLTGYLSWRVLNLAGLKELSTGATRAARGTVNRPPRPGRSNPSATYIVTALTVLIIFFAVFFWNIEPAMTTARRAPFAPSDAWMSSLIWMKENTPEPLGNPDSYYEVHEMPPPGESYKYPESAYGVMAWWDYGYWITRIAHRIPNANPSQSPKALTSVASFFTSQDEESANDIAQELGSKYIVIDHETTTGKFYALIEWAGGEESQYQDVYLAQQENQWVLVQLYHPEYYRSLSTRLYNFDGKAVTPKSTIAISYQENTDQQGNLYKVITSFKQFTGYEEAEAYLSDQESANYKIVGVNPFISPVPLEALEDYRLIYSSADTITIPNVGAVPEVKIFEYLD